MQFMKMLGDGNKKMFINDFPTYSSSNEDILKFFVKFEEWTNQLLKCPFLVGTVLDKLSLSATPQNFYHGLTGGGRAQNYTGYLVLSQDASSSIYSPTRNDPKNHITLAASNNVIATIWVF